MPDINVIIVLLAITVAVGSAVVRLVHAIAIFGVILTGGIRRVKKEEV